jgi:hypothetical protein
MDDNIRHGEVQRGEMFAHRTEPIISFARREVWVNMGCLKRMSDTSYVHFLLFRQTRKLLLKPGLEETMNVFRWCTPSGKPRRVKCDDELWQDITSLMGWSDTSRYRLLGRFVRGTNGGDFAFDLTRAEVFPLVGTPQPLEADKMPTLTWDEHCKNPLITRFQEDTVIAVGEGSNCGTTNNRTQAVLVRNGNDLYLSNK